MIKIIADSDKDLAWIQRIIEVGKEVLEESFRVSIMERYGAESEIYKKLINQYITENMYVIDFYKSNKEGTKNEK